MLVASANGNSATWQLIASPTPRQTLHSCEIYAEAGFVRIHKETGLWAFINLSLFVGFDTKDLKVRRSEDMTDSVAGSRDSQFVREVQSIPKANQPAAIIRRHAVASALVPREQTES